MANTGLTFQTEPNLDAQAYIDLLERSGFAPRRPVDDAQRIADMIAGAQIVLTARDNGTLIGAARSITDWSYCLYCSDLFVDKVAQGRGIGTQLLQETVKLTPKVKTHFLLSAPKAVNFYEKAGFQRHPDAFIFHQGS